MSRRKHALERDPIARDVRSLPSAPSLEYERKEAKALLKQIRGGNDDALQRVQSVHPVSLRDRSPDQLKLADAQHVIAREYGFPSWPRLVDYFREMERHRDAPRYNSSDELFGRLEEFAQGVMRRHQRGDPIVARELAHFVPRFYARPTAEILATPITEDEARLVFAREHRRVSWAELVERASASRAIQDERTWKRENTPLSRARLAMRAADHDALTAILDQHPELLTPSVIEREWRNTLGGLALIFERKNGTPGARRITDLLASRGVDMQRELNEQLLGWPHDWRGPSEAVRWYLERGANPDWMPPNGITVLEHAIARYMNGECVDLIAARVTPRRALWIAAGLGDVVGVKSFIAKKGKLTREGRLNRPDHLAMGSRGACPANHEADDLEIMYEAFQIAGWNQRWAAMDALLEAGLPVDYALLGMPLIIEAVGNMMVPLAEHLVSRGADLDRVWPSSQNRSARSWARDHIEHSTPSEEALRMLAICGAGTAEEILAERDAKRQSPPPPDERTLRAMQLAADDAARQSQSAVTTENMLVGLLRLENGVFASFFKTSGADMPKLRALLGARLLPDSDPLLGQDLPADADAEAALNTAATEAYARRHEAVNPLLVLNAILNQQNGPGARMLAELGASEAKVREIMKDM